MTLARVTSGEFWLSVRVAISALGRRQLLAPFLLYGAAQLGTVLWLRSFHFRGWSPAAEPVVRLLGGEVATHYPQFYVALPLVLEKAFVLLHMVLGSLLMGAATVLFWKSFGRGASTLREAICIAGRRYLRLLGIVVVIDLVAVTLSTSAYRLASGGSGGVLAGPFVGRGLGLFLALAVQSLGAYAVPSVMITNLGFAGALRRTLQIAGRNPAITFIIMAVGLVPHVPLRYLVSKSLVIVENLKPELVAWVVGIDVLMAVVTGFFMVAAITRLYLFAVGEE